jgi:hypothetical protein
LWFGVVPLLLAIPFALTWLDPPPEHGARCFLAFLAQKLARNVTWTRLPPWHELAAADGLLAFMTVVNQYRRGDALGPADQQDLGSIRYERGAVWVSIGRRLRPRAVFRASTVNLDAASALTRRGARAQWGGVLNALPHPIQIVIRSRPAATMPVLERIKRHRTRQAQDLAGWLGAHLQGA